MIVDVVNTPSFRHLSVIDTDTNNVIPYVPRADDRTGEYEQFKLNDKGKPYIGENGELERVIKKGNIVFADLRNYY